MRKQPGIRFEIALNLFSLNIHVGRNRSLFCRQPCWERAAAKQWGRVSEWVVADAVAVCCAARPQAVLFWLSQTDRLFPLLPCRPLVTGFQTFGFMAKSNDSWVWHSVKLLFHTSVFRKFEHYPPNPNVKCGFFRHASRQLFAKSVYQRRS